MSERDAKPIVWITGARGLIGNFLVCPPHNLPQHFVFVPLRGETLI